MACISLAGIAVYGDAYHHKTLPCGKLNYLQLVFTQQPMNALC